MVEYLKLFKGDGTDFSLNQKICIKLVTDYDLEGCTAHVKFYDYEQTFYPIVNKKLPLSFPGAVTSKFPLGRGLAKIWLTEPNPDGSGTLRRTVENDLKILVTNNIDLLSCNDISYTMLLRYDYKDLDSKPMLNGKVIEGDHTDDYYDIKGPAPDNELSEKSENAVQNKVIAVKFKEMDETVSEHINAKSGNPHGVTAEQVGLGNVDNTADADKPVSVLQQEAIAAAKEQVANLVQAEARRATGREQELQDEIDKTFEVVVADSLPSPSEQYSKKLYLIPSTNPETRNVKDEFICVKIADVWGWEHIGSTTITIEFDDKPTEGSRKAARSGGIWSWVKSLLPRWLTSDYAEPATVESVANKADKSVLNAHTENTNNPHKVTAEQIGALGNSGSQKLNQSYSGLSVTFDAKGTLYTGQYAPSRWSIMKEVNDQYYYVQFFGFNGTDYPSFNLFDGESDFYIRLPRKEGTLALQSDVESKADKPALPVTNGHLAALTADGNLSDSGKTVDDFLPSEGDVSVDGSITSRSAINFIFFPRIGVNSSGVYAGIYVSSFSEIKIGSAEFPTGEESDLQDALDLKANKATTLAGYGITDAATKEEVGEKANSADIQGMVRETMSADGISSSGINIGGSISGQKIRDQYGDLREAINGKVGSFSSVGGATATVDNGVAELDDFFTESNSLLTSRVNTLIDAKVGDVNAVLAAALDGTEVA